jgi:integrase/recombinase XerD
MRQAQTLTDAQLRRVLHYCRSRRHPLRDETIILTSFYAGLRAIEIAALKYADVYDEQGSVRDQFTLRATQSKGGRTRTVYIGSKLKRALKEYQASIVRHREGYATLPQSKRRPLLSKHHVPAVPRYLQGRWAQEMQAAIRGAGPTSRDWRTKAWACAYWLSLRGIRIFPTTQRYIDVNAEQLKEAVELL